MDGQAHSSTGPEAEKCSHHFTSQRLDAVFFIAKENIKAPSYITAASIIFAAFNLVQRGVREVEFLGTVIYGQAIGSFDVTADDHEHIGSIQRSPHDAGSLLIPVGPEHDTVVGTDTGQA